MRSGGGSAYHGADSRFTATPEGIIEEENGSPRRRSIALIVIGVVFTAAGLAWAAAVPDQVRGGTLTGFDGIRTVLYALTYLGAGVGMLLHARWAPAAVGAWAVVAFSQLVYPPIPADRMPMLAQIALGLIALFWMLGLVFFVRHRTRRRSAP